MTDIIRGCRKALRTEVPRKVSMMGCSRAAIKPPLLLVSHPPRSSFSTRVTRHWWEGRPPSRYSGCRGDSVHPADITCHHCRVRLLAKLVLTPGMLLVWLSLLLLLSVLLVPHCDIITLACHSTGNKSEGRPTRCSSYWIWGLGGWGICLSEPTYCRCPAAF